ncbi:MAG: hypothetical protein HF973_16390 [Chloroflexi bacterium]|nr:hypothetical protein [Chloroflexota bacterium]
MITDTKIKVNGLQTMTKHPGDVETERLTAPVHRESFDDAKWRQGLWEELSFEEISREAMELRQKNKEKPLV